MREATRSWTQRFPYYELSVGKTLVHDGGGGRTVIELCATSERAAELTVDGKSVTIPLGHFSPTTTEIAAGDVPNLVDVGGARIAADVTKEYMRGTRYSLTQLNLHGDARLFVGDSGTPMSPPGDHVFPLPDYDWNYADNWLNAVPYGWHLGIDMNAERGHPIVNVTDGRVIAMRYVSDPSLEDYWGNNLGVLGDDGVLYCYMHWDALSPGITEGVRVRAGDQLGAVGKSGFETKPYLAHLHLEMMLLQYPERFCFAYELEPDVLPTPNRVLQPAVQGHVINPYPYLVEWYLGQV